MSHLDLEVISHLAAFRDQWSEQRRICALRDYESYLDRIANGAEASPTVDVDCMWHLHILHTRSYTRYCDVKFGRYLHHVSCLTDDEFAFLENKLDGVIPDFILAGQHYRAQDDQRFSALANCGAGDTKTISRPADGIAHGSANCGSGDRTITLKANCGSEKAPPSHAADSSNGR